MNPAHPPFEQSICFFHTADLAATRGFYETQLGLPMVLDQGACQIFKISVDGYVGFCTHRQPTNTDGIIITLVTTEVETVCARLKASGVSFEKMPSFNERFNITNAFLKDPNGYLVEIQRFEDPNWVSHR